MGLVATIVERNNKVNVISISKDGIILKQNNKLGLFNCKGYEIIPCEYDTIEKYNSYFVVKKGEFYGVFDKRGNAILDCKHSIYNAKAFIEMLEEKEEIIEKESNF